MELLEYVNNLSSGSMKTNIIHLSKQNIVIHVRNREEFNSLIKELELIKNLRVGSSTREDSYGKYRDTLCISIDDYGRDDGALYMTRYCSKDYYINDGNSIIEYSSIRGGIY